MTRESEPDIKDAVVPSGSGVFRAGTVALIGPPNAGKSTLMNALLGQKLAIVAPRPQTTRRLLRGVLALPGAQAVLLDTPGLFEGHNALEWGMRGQALAALRDADLVLALVSRDTRKAWLEEGIPRLPRRRTVLVATKSDEGPHRDAEALALEMDAALGGVKSRLTVSALKKRGLEELKSLIGEAMPEGGALFPDDQLTDSSLRETAAEIIREKVLLLCRDEVPHALAVGIDQYREREDGLHEIHATLYIERESQKAIVIGAGGSRLKEIGTRARADIERQAEAKVFLQLWVKVRKDWKKEPGFLKELGYPSGKRPNAVKA